MAVQGRAVADGAVADDKSVMQGQDWAGEMGEKWNRHLQQFETMIAPIGAAVMELAALQPGERVLDIGCGGGNTTLAIAAQLGPHGEALGLDISPVLIDTAKRRARESGLPQPHFACVDAATATLSRNDFDVLYSRFGVMFFDDPAAAFRNLRRMLATPARLAFCCWGPPPRNPWVAELMAVVSRHVTLPQPNPTAPGPFAFADAERTRGILEQAGFSEVSFTPWQGPQLLGGPGLDAAAAADFAMKAFFVGDAVANQSDAVRAAVLQDVIELFRQRQTPQGVAMEAMAWLVSARCQ